RPEIFSKASVAGSLLTERTRKNIIRFDSCKPFQRTQAAFEPHLPHPFGKGFTRLVRSEFAPLVEDSDLEFEDALGTDVKAMTRLVVPDLEMVSKTLLVAKTTGLLRYLVINCFASEVPFPEGSRQSPCDRQRKDIFGYASRKAIHARHHLQHVGEDSCKSADGKRSLYRLPCLGNRPMLPM
ncbi:hypothetical protein, partial [Komagataeibacter oboediens]|uniref:hypothetical protein n=1 Tax=Komagataeibacter oboediens TaxID=65958 RepID=UPI000237DA8A